MKLESINNTIQEMLDEKLYHVLLNSIAENILLLVTLFVVINGFVYFLNSPKDNKNIKENKMFRVTMIYSMLTTLAVLIPINYYFVKADYNEQLTLNNKYKETSQFTEGRKKLDTPYWNYDLEVSMDSLIEDLPNNKTKDYTEFHYNEKGNVEFYFKGSLREMNYPELLTLVANKKPLLLYKEIPEDIYGIYKKGDIVNIKFITNY